SPAAARLARGAVFPRRYGFFMSSRASNCARTAALVAKARAPAPAMRDGFVYADLGGMALLAGGAAGDRGGALGEGLRRGEVGEGSREGGAPSPSRGGRLTGRGSLGE